MKKKLSGLSDIRRYFHRNDTPYWFVSATPFNLLGIDEWVRRWSYVNLIDCFDGHHPRALVPPRDQDRVFESIEEITNYLLRHKQVVDGIEANGGGKAVFLFFDEETESICDELGLQVCFPKAKLRQEIDNKVVTTRIGNEAGVPSVPNTLGKVTGYESLVAMAKKAGIGTDLVVQTAFGDSGHTTFFIASEQDYAKYAEEIEAEPEVKVMKRIRCKGAALEACVTQQGTIVGPLMTELVGFEELTPYRGGWCGNEVNAEAFPLKVREQARDYTFKFGEALRKRGYRGYFEVDYLTDLDADELYLGEVNPRVTGASSMTNLAAFAHADAPLFLFHLLEFADVEFELDVQDLNRRWSDPENIDDWGQLVIKFTKDEIQHVKKAPASGIYELMPDGSLQYVRMQTHRRTAERENRAFFLRIVGEGDYFYEGADLGILVSRGRLMTEDFQLNERGRAWTRGIRALYHGEPLVKTQAEQVASRIADAGGFKML
ncbi:MAG: biotin carboxylase [Planctomycetes bacterium]|nr:biotin carboxylase [Planctomycetota bacterium]